MTFNQVSGPAVEPGAGIEEEPEKYSKPVTQQDSGSEHSVHSQISLEKVYFGKTQSFQPSQVKSDKSVGSVRSRNRGKGKLVMAGQSGSDYPKRETLEKIRSMDSVGGQSNHKT